jgi:hypothetical protein
VAAKRKVSKKPMAKKSAKPAPPAKRAREQERETHYSDLRKVMLASVLKRLK